jgi:hypothetical protein
VTRRLSDLTLDELRQLAAKLAGEQRLRRHRSGYPFLVPLILAGPLRAPRGRGERPAPVTSSFWTKGLGGQHSAS